MAGKDAGLRIRVERGLRDDFLKICRAQDRPAAQVIREFMRRYVSENEADEDNHTYQGRLFWPAAFRDEVLARLLALNSECHAEEVRLGIAPGIKGEPQESEENEDETESEAAV